jgi:hypothetical protein
MLVMSDRVMPVLVKGPEQFLQAFLNAVHLNDT